MKPLHSKKQNEMEATDQRIFSRVVVLAGIALVVLLAIGLLLVKVAGKHVDLPHTHTVSSLASGAASGSIDL
jgi:hypothetical protein